MHSFSVPILFCLVLFFGKQYTVGALRFQNQHFAGADKGTVMRILVLAFGVLALCSVAVSCRSSRSKTIPGPFISGLYSADPSAHVFNGRLYVYPSHDRKSDARPDNDGSQYDMVDYHVYSTDSVYTAPTDHGVALALEDVPWASKQLWAPDAAHKNGLYYLFFPARDKENIFRIGVATSKNPEGPFTAEPNPIAGSFSMDPCSFVDDDGKAYLYFGGLWGGQLEKWQTGSFDPSGREPGRLSPALGPRVARLSEDMLSFESEALEVQILDEQGTPVVAGNNRVRFFEGAWVHKRKGVYYLSYSTGDTHLLAYATSDNPLGPFTYRGVVLEPVAGWTTHHSIVEFRGKWYLFYHDAAESKIDYLRNVRAAPLEYGKDGSIKTVQR